MLCYVSVKSEIVIIYFLFCLLYFLQNLVQHHLDSTMRSRCDCYYHSCNRKSCRSLWVWVLLEIKKKE